MGTAVLRLRVVAEGEGGWEPGPGVAADDDDGSGGGVATGQPSTRIRSSRLFIRGQGTERLMVMVSPSWLTVRGKAADDESGGESHGDVGLAELGALTVLD